MKKTLLASLGLATSLLAITQEQQMELDKIFEEKISSIKTMSLTEERKERVIKMLKRKKEEIEKQSDEKIDSFIAQSKEAPYKLRLSENDEEIGDETNSYSSQNTSSLLGWFFGASGLRLSSFINSSSGNSAIMFYGSIGPKYNFSSGGATMPTAKGFSLALPIGIGMMSNPYNDDKTIAIPIAIEGKYMFSDVMGFGLSAGLRYTFSPQNMGNLHIMDFYSGIDIYYGIYLEAGYVFYSSQDITLGNRTYSTDPLSGAITLNVGWRF